MNYLEILELSKRRKGQMLQDSSTCSSTSIYKNKKWARIPNVEVVATDLVYLPVQFRKQL